jgi:membrane fusion protein, multidrug efflux system
MDEITSSGSAVPAGSGGSNARGKAAFWQRRWVVVMGTAALAGGLFVSLHFVVESFTHESTDDAFLDATVISIAPRVAGQAAKVPVAANERVQAGDPLVELDPRDFEVQVAQKRAALASAEANVKVLEAAVQLLVSQVASAAATARQAEAEAAADQASAEKARADLRRAEDLWQRKAISPQEYDSAKAGAEVAGATWKAGEEKAEANRTGVAESQAQLNAGRRSWERAQAQARQSGVDLQQAELNLSYTRIAAPQGGRVTHKAVEAGDYVQVGQRLMAVVADDTYVTANFKETQLQHIRPGQPVRIRVDSLGGRMFAGRVESLQAGSGAAFSLLPPENAVGNYVKVVQRVPVKILFDRPIEAEHPLGPGMSVVPSVQVARFDVPDLIIAIAACAFAAAGGVVWSRAAKRRAPTSG